MSTQVDVVDVSSGEIRRGPSMRHPRFGHAAAASATSLFVFGGLGPSIRKPDGEIKDSCEVFSPQTRQ